jgi:hypothetical protein
MENSVITTKIGGKMARDKYHAAISSSRFAARQRGTDAVFWYFGARFELEICGQTAWHRCCIPVLWSRIRARLLRPDSVAQMLYSGTLEQDSSTDSAARQRGTDAVFWYFGAVFDLDILRRGTAL